MPEITVPVQSEDYRFGMDSLNSPKKLRAHVQQLLENSYPGATLKPLNGVKDAFVSTTQLGYGTKDSLFQQRGVFVEANDKEFFFAWHHNSTTTDEYALEIWNLTDSSRTKLIYGDFDQSVVYFNMEKLYDAVYITMNYEMTINHVSTYRTKNKIVEWDSTAGAWLVREMGIDVAGSIGNLVAKDVSGVEFGAVSFHHIIKFKNKYWKLGGRTAAGADGEDTRIYSSDDGRTWAHAGNFSETAMLGFSVLKVDLGDPTGEVLVKIGGENGAGVKTDKVYKSINGVSWSEIGTFNGGDIGYHKSLFYNGLLWVIGGLIGATYQDKVWSSPDGITWTDVGSNLPRGIAHHTSLVFNSLMWIIAGVTSLGVELDEVFSSPDGVTWTLVNGNPAFDPVSMHSSIVFNNKMWLFCGFTQASAYEDWAYYTTDGDTWTLGINPMNISDARAGTVVFEQEEDGKLMLVGGEGAAYYDDLYESNDGITWISGHGLDDQDYYSYGTSYVRRNDSYAILDAASSYEGTKWDSIDGVTVPGVDEKILTGTVNALGGGTLTGTNTLFSTELAVGSHIRVDGLGETLTVLSIADNTNAVTDSHFTNSLGKEYALVPSINDPVSTNIFHPGIAEGIETVANRKTVLVSVIDKPKGQVYIYMPDLEGILDVVAQGATHIRIFRGLGNPVKTTAEGLSKHFLYDVAITGDAFIQGKILIDKKTDDALGGITNLLQVTPYSVPPLGRYCIWANDLLYIGGVPGEDGKWFHSVVNDGVSIAFNVRYPQKYASWFNLDENFVTCDPQDGQKDTGCAWLHGDLYLFKERKIFVIYGGDPNNKPVRISRTVGCACPESIENGDIPHHGEVIFFISDSGPAYISSGGKVVLFTAFTIAELWPKNTGVLTRSTGVPTNWYTRNRVVSRFWNNTWWIFFGDGRDGSNQISTHMIVGYNFSTDGDSMGPFVRKQDYGLEDSDFLSYIDIDDQGNISQDVALDPNPEYRIMFLAKNSRGIDVYKYDSGANLTHTDFDGRGDRASSVTVDTINKIVFVANGGSGIDSYKYDTGGILSYVDTNTHGISFPHIVGITIHAEKKLLFAGACIEGFESYNYDEDGNMSFIEKYDPGEDINIQHMTIDTRRKFLFAGALLDNDDIYSVSYNEDNGALSFVNSISIVGSARKITIDEGERLVVLASYNGGVNFVRYSKTGTLRFVARSTGEAADIPINGVDVDTANKILYTGVFRDGGPGDFVFAYSYDNNGEIVKIDSSRGEGGYSGANAVKIDTTNHIAFLAYNDGGVITFKINAKNKIYEPKMLMPVDNNRAYTLSHCPDAAGDIHYRLTQFLDPAIWQDVFDEITLSYKMKWQTRYLFSGPSGIEMRRAIKVLLNIDFEDDEDLIFTINVDGTRLTATKTYSQTRQSGVSSSGSDSYRSVITMFTKENLRPGKFHDLIISKVVPSDGNVEVFAQKILLGDETIQEDEFYDSFNDAAGATTFVVEADASPEVEA